MAEKKDPYFPEQLRDPYNQRELIYVNSKISLASFDFFVRKNELKDLGYPENFFELNEFKGLTSFDKHVERTRALHEVVGPLGFQIDDGIQTLLAVDIKKDKKLSQEEEKEAKDFIEGIILTTNYYERLTTNGGNVGLFVATTEMSRGGVVSPDDNARLNMRHLKAIVKNIPEVSDVIAIIDREYSRPFDLDNTKTWKHRGPQEILEEIPKDSISLNISDERFESIKILARAWYDLLGMPDIRSFQHKDKIIQKHMPQFPMLKGKRDYPQIREDFINKKFGILDIYRGIPLEYNSVMAFIMDPIKLQSSVLKNFKGIGIELSMVSARLDSSPHNIFNLGWMPAGLKVLEAIVDSPLSMDAIADRGFHNLQLKDLTDNQWGEIEKRVDWQKNMINQLEKADGAKVAFLKLFSFDAKAIVDMYSNVASYLRESEEEKNGILIREKVLSMMSSAVLAIFSAQRRKGSYSFEKRDITKIINIVEEHMWPDKPFTEQQKEKLIALGQDDLLMNSIKIK